MAERGEGLGRAATFRAAEDGTFHGRIGEDWCQGRTAFGGLLATAAARAAGSRAEPGRVLRSALVAFVAPVASGSCRIRVSHLRSGSSLTFVQAQVEQAGRVCTTLTAGFGLGRAGSLEVPAAPRPAAPAPGSLEPLPYLPGLTPTFSQHFDYRWTAPVAPYSGADQALVQGWIRPREPEQLDAAGLLALIDAWPPPIITRAAAPLPLSSITWQVNLLRVPPAEGLDPAAWWFYEDRCRAAGLGYSDSEGRLWGPDGELAATSRQLVADFSAPDPEGQPRRPADPAQEC